MGQRDNCCSKAISSHRLIWICRRFTDPDEEVAQSFFKNLLQEEVTDRLHVGRQRNDPT